MTFQTNVRQDGARRPMVGWCSAWLVGCVAALLALPVMAQDGSEPALASVRTAAYDGPAPPVTDPSTHLVQTGGAERAPVKDDASLAWPTSVAASHHADGALWLADASAGTLVRVDLDNGFEPFAPEPQVSDEQFVRQIRATDDGYLLLFFDKKTFEPRLYRAGRDLAAELRTPGNLERVAVPAAVTAIFDFVAVGDGILALGDVEIEQATADYPTPDWYTSLFWFRPGGPIVPIVSNFEGLLRERNGADTDPKDGTPYALYNYTTDDTMRYLAAGNGGDTAYMLLLQNPVRLAKIGVRDRSFDVLDRFPRDLETLPALTSDPRYQAADSINTRLSATLRIKQESTYAAGVFVDGSGAPVVLGRRVTSAMTPAWDLVRVDPQRGDERERFTLPTGAEAAHLLVSDPTYGSGGWRVLTKAAVVDLADRPPYLAVRELIWLE